MAMRKVRRGLSITVIVLVLVAFVGGFFWLKTQDGRGKHDITSATIAESFEDVSELATQKYEFSDVGKRTEDGRKLFGWNVPLTGSSFLITYSGVVTAGVADFTDVEVEFQDAAKQVLVRLPVPEILNAEIDPASIVVYDQSFNPFNPTNVEDVSTFLAEEDERSRQNAIDKGIIERAQEQAETLATEHVRAILMGTDKADYDVVVSFQ